MVIATLKSSPMIATVRMNGFAITTVMPSPISDQMLRRSSRRGGVSLTRTAATATAETTNDSASARIANGAVMSCTSSPPRLGPTTRATDSESASFAFASTSASRPTSAGMNGPYAARKSTVIEPATNAAMRTCSMRRTPATAASGIVTRIAARARSVTTRIGFRGRRSDHAPANSEKNRYGSQPAATSRPICCGVAFRLKAAVSGSATNVTDEPMAEIDWPIQSLRNSPDSIVADARRRSTSALQKALLVCSRSRSACANAASCHPSRCMACGAADGVGGSRAAPHNPCCLVEVLDVELPVTTARVDLEQVGARAGPERRVGIAALHVRGDVQELAVGAVDVDLQLAESLRLVEDPVDAPVIADREGLSVVEAAALPHLRDGPHLPGVGRRGFVRQHDLCDGGPRGRLHDLHLDHVQQARAKDQCRDRDPDACARDLRLPPCLNALGADVETSRGIDREQTRRPCDVARVHDGARSARRSVRGARQFRGEAAVHAHVLSP